MKSPSFFQSCLLLLPGTTENHGISIEATNDEIVLIDDISREQLTKDVKNVLAIQKGRKSSQNKIPQTPAKIVPTSSP